MDLNELLQRRPYNAAVDFVDANVQRGLGDKTAFIEGARKVTYAELQQGTFRMAHALRMHGFPQETRVAMILPDVIEYPIAFWGAIRAGVVPIPTNTLLNAEQYAYILEDSRAAAVFTSLPIAQKIAPVLDRLPHLRMVVVVGGKVDDKKQFGGRPVLTFDEFLKGANAEPFTAPTVSDEVAFWLYSSGSTGNPKGTQHVHTSLMYTAVTYAHQVLGIRSDDVVYSAAKIFFAYGLGNSMTFPMSVGATTVLLPERPTPDAVFALAERERPTMFFGAPSLYGPFLADKRLSRGMGSDRLRLCVSAGEALPAHVGERWREKVGVDILDGIGSTEMLHIFVSNRPDDIRYGTSGKPVPGYEAKIIDEDGKEVGADEIGELIIRGASAADGYWNQREKSRRTFRGEWTYTGDKYTRDAEGYYSCCGRTDDMFKASGIWVSPYEVEAALISHEAVLEAAVIGQADQDGNLKPKAFLVMKEGYQPDPALLEALKQHVKEKAGPWKYPRWIEIRSELPKTATGKIQRFKLREESAAAENTGQAA